MSQALTVAASSSSSSSSSSDDQSTPSVKPATEDTTRSGDEKDQATTEAADVATTAETSAPPQQTITPEQAFEAFYLKQATKEFATDLENLRSAPDFKAGSVDILIEALRQGTACFSGEERRRIAEAGIAS